MSDQDHSSLSQPAPLTAESSHGGASGSQPHAHHLRFGDITVSGFAPTDLQDDDASDLDDPCHATKDSSTRRRKMTRDRTRELLDSEARRIHGERRYIFRKPRPLQYFRGETLVRANEERASGRLELFFDLTFVGIIAVLAQSAVETADGPGLVRYIITYSAAYMIWNWMREMFNSFYKDDLSQRILVLFVMACLVLYGNNAIKAEQSLDEGPARAVSVASYLLAEFAIFSSWLLYSFYIKAYRAQLRAHCLSWLISTPIWIASIFVSVRAAIAMSVVAIVFEWWSWIFIYSKYFKRWLKLRYSSAVALEHEIERYQDFFTIVMGEFVYSLFDGNPTTLGFHAKAGRALMSLVIAFCFQLFYMHGSGSKRITHPLRHSMPRGIAFLSLHLPVVSALTLCGDAFADFVKEEAVESGVRWMACASFSVGIIGLWMIASLEEDRDVKGELWLPKSARLAPRLVSGIIAVFLPLTHQKAPEEEPTGEESHAVTHLVHRAFSVLAEGAAAASEAHGEAGEHGEAGAHSEESVGVQHGGPNMTTTKILGILTALAAFTLLWEIFTSLDGPEAKHETATDELIQRAKDGHALPSTLETPKWRGYPTFCEPGSGTFDWTHQRDHAKKQLSRADSHDSGTAQLNSSRTESPEQNA